jgi:hypothetical protein
MESNGLMHFITLNRDTGFDGWRKTARVLALNGVKPSDVTWKVRGSAPASIGPPTAARESTGRAIIGRKNPPRPIEPRAALMCKIYSRTG